MNLSEFKAWFEGFTENLDGPPGEKAWKKIQAKVKAIDGAPTTERVFVERWWSTYYPPVYLTPPSVYSPPLVPWCVPIPCGAYSSGGGLSNQSGPMDSVASWNSGEAFTALGRAESMQ